MAAGPRGERMKRRDLILGIAGAIAAPGVASAQQSDRPRRVGVLMSTAETEPHEQSAVAVFVQSLEKLDWTQGRNVEITFRWGNGDGERMAANAREMVALAPDIILVKGANLPALRALTSTIPIVFVLLSDAVAQRYVASFARPGGNVTGFSSDERALVGKRLELLRTISPQTKRVLYLRSRSVGTDTNPLYERIVEDGPTLGIAVGDGSAQSAAEIENAVASFAGVPDSGLVAAFDAFITVHAALIVDLAARYHLPAVFSSKFFTENGGLLSYGFDQDDQFRQAASYVDRILKGAKPADLPVQFPTRFQLVINSKTASALGLTVPQLLLMQADEIIE
jgi:putative tryptophan/tyrosine transport system substrate-binding protein